MRVLLMTNEFPPNIYGGAGVHVEYLSRELSRLTPVEVRSFQEQDFSKDQLKVLGTKIDASGYHCSKELVSPLKALATCLNFNIQGIDADIVHARLAQTSRLTEEGKQLAIARLGRWQQK